MADITMCTGVKKEERGLITCPFRKQCYRFTAPINPVWQAWFSETPLKWPIDGAPSCEHMMR